MSDLLFSSRRREEGELARILGRWLGPVGSAVSEWSGEWGTLAVLCAPHDPKPAYEDERSISVLIGEPYACLPGLPHGPACDPERRAALHRRLADGPARGWAEMLDGQFAAISISKATGRGMLLTDLFGWVPLFASARRAPVPHLVAGSHVDAVAEAAGARAELDLVSAVELLGYYTASAPHTLYSGVQQLWAGSTQEFRPSGWDGAERPYWRPTESTEFTSVREAAEALREAIVGDVRRTVEGHPRVGMLLSGGEDSRVVLGAVPHGVRVQGFVYAERESREVRSARRVARAYGAELRYEQRPPGHDLRHFPTVAAMVGSQNEFIDVHGYGLHASMGIDALPVVLGGFSSDALLKGDNVSRAARRRILRGEPAGIRAAEPPALPGVHDELLRAAADRRDAFRGRLAEIRPESAEEWSFIYPFSMRKYAAGFHGNRRLFHSHEPFMTNAVARVAAGVPQAWKLDRKLFYAMARPLLRASWYVPHTRNRLPYLPHRVNAAARPILGLARDLRAIATGSVGANQESWPVWEELVRTPEMEASFREHPLWQSPLGILFPDPELAALEIRQRWAPLRQLVALQLAFLTRR